MIAPTTEIINKLVKVINASIADKDKKVEPSMFLKAGKTRKIKIPNPDGRGLILFEPVLDNALLIDAEKYIGNTARSIRAPSITGKAFVEHAYIQQLFESVKKVQNLSAEDGKRLTDNLTQALTKKETEK
jgi:hypothetical protein